MTALLKGVIACSSAILLSGGIDLSWAADSTGTPYSGASTPTVSTNQPFLLDTGYADVNQTSSSWGSWPATTVAPGQYWNPGFIQNASSGVPEAIRLTILTNQHVCPANFKAVVTVAPYKSLLQGNESMRACADSISNFDATRYWFGVWVNTVTDVNGNNVPATSFFWSVYCYPSSSYATTSNPTTVDASASGPCSPAISYYAPQPILWDQGTINGPAPTVQSSQSTQGSETAAFQLPRGCPANYQPYVIMHFNNPSVPSYYQAVNSPTSGPGALELQGIGVCVTSIDNNPSPNTVHYLRATQANVFAQYETGVGSNMIYVTDSTTPNYSDYLLLRDRVDTSNRSGYHVVNGANFTNENFTNYNQTDIYSWVLYCLPPGYGSNYYANFTNPSTNCATGKQPF